MLKKQILHKRTYMDTNTVKETKEKRIFFSLIFLVRLFYYWKVCASFPLYTLDSPGYVNFPFEEYMRLEFTSIRTPVYPAIIWLFQQFFGPTAGLKAVAAFQIIFSSVSIIFLYEAIRKIIQNKKITYLVSMMYACSPIVMGFDVFITTESLALSWTVIYLYFMISFLEKPNIRAGLTAIALSLLMTLCKPSILPYMYITLAFWIIRFVAYKNERKLMTTLILASFGTLCLTWIYSYLIFTAQGSFAITPLAPRHLLAKCLDSGVYKAYSDIGLVNQVNEIFVSNHYDIGWDTTNPIMYLLGNGDIRECNGNTMLFCKTCIRNNPIQFIRYSINEFIESIDVSFSPYIAGMQASVIGELPEYNIDFEVVEGPFTFQNLLFRTLSLLDLKIGHTYLLCIGEMVIVIYTWIKKHAFSWLHFGLFGFLFLNTVFVMLGTYGDYARCLIHILPFVYVSIACCLSMTVKKCSTETDPLREEDQIGRRTKE